MSKPETTPTAWVTGFQGENRVAPEHMLPPNISPDALNIDYLDGTLKKRPGLARLHRQPMCSGSMLVCDSRGGNRYARLLRSAPMDFGGTDPFEYEFAMCYDQKTAPASSPTGLESYVIDDMDGGGTDGIRLVMRWNGTNWRFRLYVGNSSGTAATLDHTTNLTARATYVVRIKHHPGANDFSLDVNGTSVNGNYGANTFVYNSDTHLIFGTTGFDFSPNGLRVAIDDFRIWDGTAQVPIIDAVTAANRAMTASEIATHEGTGALVAYYTFDEQNATDDWDSAGGVVTADVESVGAVVRSMALVLGGAASTITGMIPVFGTATETDLLICTEDAIYLLNYATDSVTLLHLLDIPSTTRWSFARHSRYIILSNGVNPNLRYSTTGGIRRLSFEEPNAAFTATVSATGGTFGSTGVLKYLFSLYDSVTGQEGPVYTTAVISATLAATTDKVTLDNFPMADEIGMDSFKIYRTEPGGSAYYYLTTIPYALNTSYVDDNTPAVDTTTPWNQYKGHAEPSLFVLQHLGYIFACNQDGATDRVRYSEPGTPGDFYFANTLKVGEDSGDELTGGVVAGGVPVLFKRNAIYIITGSGPSTFGIRKLADLPGCVHHATIGVSQAGVYYQSNDGVYILPFPIGGTAPQDITENSQRTLFGRLNDDRRREAYGLFDSIEQRYYTGLNVGDTRRTLTYDQRDGAWGLWDLTADCFTNARPEGGVSVVLVGRSGYVCRIDRDQLADGLVSSDNTYTTVSFTTAATVAALDYVTSPATLPYVSTGGPLRNLRVKLTYPSGVTEYATVAYSSATLVRFTEPVTGVAGGIPAATVVSIEPIIWNWATARHTYDGEFDLDKAWYRFRALFGATGNASLSAYVIGKDEDGAAASPYTFTISTDKRNWVGDITVRGDEVKFGFSGESNDTEFDLAAFKLEFQERTSQAKIGMR